ncbi:MAG TPA: hypothetical protein VGP65_08255 [Candidatus Angelobacter sp.]|jgi:hypothetical protein|nr:hypothetical protein [Candidatus Angelobacter sp.]
MSSARTSSCPKCGQAVLLPREFTNSDLLRTPACPACRTKLVVMPPHAAKFLTLMCLAPVLFFSVPRLLPGLTGIVLIALLLGGYVIGLVALVKAWRRESKHPVLKVMTLPKPEISLNLGLKNPENIRQLR